MVIVGLGEQVQVTAVPGDAKIRGQVLRQRRVARGLQAIGLVVGRIAAVGAGLVHGVDRNVVPVRAVAVDGNGLERNEQRRCPAAGNAERMLAAVAAAELRGALADGVTVTVREARRTGGDLALGVLRAAHHDALDSVGAHAGRAARISATSLRVGRGHTRRFTAATLGSCSARIAARAASARPAGAPRPRAAPTDGRLSSRTAIGAADPHFRDRLRQLEKTPRQPHPPEQAHTDHEARHRATRPKEERRGRRHRVNASKGWVACLPMTGPRKQGQALDEGWG
jgi:hypothetical protein